MSSKNFLTFIIMFAAGSFAGCFFEPVQVDFLFYFGLFFVFLSAVFLLLFKFLNFSRRVFVLSLILFSFGLGMSWCSVKSAPPKDIYLLEKQVGEKVILEAVVVDEPDEREKYMRYVLETDDGIKFLITANYYPKFDYGDKLMVKGTLKKPSNSDDSDFDWRAYLAKDGIYFEIFYPEIELVASKQASFIKQKLFSLKRGIMGNIFAIIPEPHSALLGGLTFGAKQSMPADLLEDFRKTGIIHIVVLSGYNITIVADAIIRCLSFLPSFVGIGFGVLGITAFAIMVGASATVVRASLMAILILLARATGRIYEVTVALFVAGFLMILNNPKVIRFDSSFQLSFLATMALLWVSPLIEPRLKFLPKKFQIREITTATIATQIFVLPLLLYKMGMVSVVGLPVNLLVLFFIPATMFFGSLTAIVASISYFIAAPFGWITYGLLQYELTVVKIFANLPFASLDIPIFPMWLMWLTYAIYAILIFKLTKRLKKD